MPKVEGARLAVTLTRPADLHSWLDAHPVNRALSVLLPADSSVDPQAMMALPLFHFEYLGSLRDIAAPGFLASNDGPAAADGSAARVVGVSDSSPAAVATGALAVALGPGRKLRLHMNADLHSRLGLPGARSACDPDRYVADVDLGSKEYLKPDSARAARVSQRLGTLPATGMLLTRYSDTGCVPLEGDDVVNDQASFCHPVIESATVRCGLADCVRDLRDRELTALGEGAEDTATLFEELGVAFCMLGDEAVDTRHPFGVTEGGGQTCRVTRWSGLVPPSHARASLAAVTAAVDKGDAAFGAVAGWGSLGGPIAWGAAEHSTFVDGGGENDWAALVMPGGRCLAFAAAGAMSGFRHF